MTELLVRFQKNIFTLTLAAATVLGVSLAYLGSVVLQYLLHSRPESAAITPESSPRKVAERSVFRTLEEFLDPVITGAFIRDSGVELSAGAPGGDQAAEGEIVLLGVIAGSEQFSRAAIQMQGKNEVTEYKVGQTVGGFKIAAIGSSYIMVERGSSQLKIVIGQKSGEARAPGATIPGADKAGGPAQKITIARGKLNELTSNQDKLYEVKFAPVTIGGKIQGFRLILVPNNHFLYEMGARSGDIIRRFNGQPLENTEKMFQMYQSLKTLSRVTVEVERAGKILPFDIIIQ